MTNKWIQTILGLSGLSLCLMGFSVQQNGILEIGAGAISDVSTWDGTASNAPTKTVFMGGKTFYLIETADQLASLRSNASSNSNNYILLNDIDLSGYSFYGICANQFQKNLSTYSYSGIFDGNGHRILHFKLPGTEDSHEDYAWKSRTTTGSAEHWASEIGFIGDLGSSGILKNLAFTGASTTAGVGTTAYYWYNGGIVGLNKGTISNISTDSIRFRSDAWANFNSAAIYSVVKDSGIGVICGRNQGKMNNTTTKNSYLYVYQKGAEYKFWNTHHIYIENLRYGENVGFNNTSSSGYSYTNNYYYNNEEATSSGGNGDSDIEVDQNTTNVTSATSFPAIGGLEGTSSLIDNFCPLNSQGDVYQNQTSISLDYAARLLSYGCEKCTKEFLQKCINDYNTSSVSKRVYDNLTAPQTDAGKTVTLSVEYKLKYLATKAGLSLTGSNSASPVSAELSSNQNGVIALSVLASLALLSAGGYFFAKKKEA